MREQIQARDRWRRIVPLLNFFPSKPFKEARGAGVLARLLLVITASVVCVWLFDPALSAHANASLLWRNALPLTLLILLIYALCGYMLISIEIGVAGSWLLLKINAVKELNMDAPIMPGDLLLAHQVTGNIDFFAHYTGYRSLLLGLVACVFFILVMLTWMFERFKQRPGWRRRLAYALLSIVMLVTLFRGDGFWAQTYGDGGLPGFDKWAPILTVRQNGLIASLVRMSQNKQLAIPVAKEDLVYKFAQSYREELLVRSENASSGVRPDIVVVQSEAFFDPGVMRKIDYGQFAPNFARLAQGGITGSLTTPTYGGGTIRTEFETLTGYPMRAFPEVEYPYFGLAESWMPTVPHRLQSLGYTTQLMHPFRSDFWNRDMVMPELGFQTSKYQPDFAHADRAGTYISDHALFDAVLSRLDERSSQPRFIMAITMENHGPWDRGDPWEPGLRGQVIPAGLSAQGEMEMKYYISHLVNGDQALGDFTRTLLARPNWTILVFYGDHLPALPAAYRDFGFDDGKAPPQEHTRYMLLSNRPLKPEQPRREDLHSYDLPGLLFDVAGLPADGYLGMSSVIRRLEERRSNQDTSQFEALQFSAAIMEVRCRHPLEISGDCHSNK